MCRNLRVISVHSAFPLRGEFEGVRRTGIGSGSVGWCLDRQRRCPSGGCGGVDQHDGSGLGVQRCIWILGVEVLAGVLNRRWVVELQWVWCRYAFGCCSVELQWVWGWEYSAASVEAGAWSLEVVRQQVVECSRVQWWVVWLLEASGGVGVWHVVRQQVVDQQWQWVRECSSGWFLGVDLRWVFSGGGFSSIGWLQIA
ncbi:hypothetical protein LOK49_LG04G00628 [Camellia lanceoleosa]|uniref:Uncharacterized protein n=1 Tax=Camellia lanceoleosa TaxID=1840588 RepID=A0ACC0I5E9_9ERIC|nr:hypothetical protein LOK49_LG04G00628 [Camellia lanceoleosa]